MSFQRFIWITLLIGGGVMLLMLHIQSRAARPQPEPGDKPAKSATAPAASAPTEKKTPHTEPSVPDVRKAPSETTWPVSIKPEHEVVLGSNDKDTGFKLQARLTSKGAAVSEIKLTDYFMTVADKRRFEQDPDTYEKAVEQDPELEGRYVLLKQADSGDEKIYPLSTRRVTIFYEGKNIWLNLAGPRWTAGKIKEEKNEKGEIQSQSVTFTAKVWRNEELFLLIKKTYTLKTGSYSIDVRLEAVNPRKAGKVKFAFTQYSATGLPKEGTRMDHRALTYGLYEDGDLEVKNIAIKDADDKTPGLAEAESLGHSNAADAKPVLWIGYTNKYFAALTYVRPMKPQAEKSGQTAAQRLAAPRANAEFLSLAYTTHSGGTQKNLLGLIKLGAYELDPGKSTQIRLDLFAGPKKRDLFEKTALYRNLGYKSTLQFRSCCSMCAFEWLSLGMIWLLDYFSDNVTGGNYGVAIILLVILVRLCLHPLMKKQQVSMMRFQKLQPEIEKVKAKYAKDKAKLNEEMMKLYKSQGASPLLGCLPIFLQMPILIALWTSINASVELRHAAFLPVWIIDLAAPDRLIPFADGYTLPLIGSFIGEITGFNLLPLLLCVVMYIQMKFNPQMSGATASPQQASSQKMMMYMMPGMMLLFFYNAASGLTLYFMTSTFAGLAEQFFIRRHIREKEAAEAALETKVVMPGKHFRGQKPKKPKGPFQIKH